MEHLVQKIESKLSGIKTRWLLLAVFLLSCVLAAIYASMDPFLHIWDEQYHALVAKHMADHPFEPILYETMLRKHDLLNWTDGHVWLHKQPFFLWLMALSIKVFGTTAMAVRLPSILMHGLMSAAILRIGQLSINRSTGLIAALFFTCAYYPLELVVGFYHTDHNDMSFIALATLSFWAWFEWDKSRENRWLWLIGLLAGLAVLTKWLIGLMVFGGWGVMMLSTRSWGEWKAMLCASSVLVAVVLPWQVYIWLKYPVVALHEFQLNSRHFWEVIEEHGGGPLYHWDALQRLYGKGDAIPFIVLVSFLLMLWQLRSLRHRILMASTVFAAYIVFSLAQTKMESFGLVVSSFMFIAMAHLVIYLSGWLSKVTGKIVQWAFVTAVTIGACVMYFDYPAMVRHHSAEHPKHNRGREGKIRELQFIKSLEVPVEDAQCAIFNANLSHMGNIPFMFFRDFAVAYLEFPTTEMVDEATSLGLTCVVIDQTETLPQWIYEDERIVIVKLHD